MPVSQCICKILKYHRILENEHIDPMINRVHAPTKVNNCVKYEQNLLYIVGCRVVTRVRRMDRQKDGQLRQGRTIPYGPNGQRIKMT